MKVFFSIIGLFLVAVFPKDKVEPSVLNMVRKLIHLFSCVYSVLLFSSPLCTSSSLSSYTFSAVPDFWWGGPLRCQCCRVQHKECQQQLHSECSHACAQAHTHTHTQTGLISGGRSQWARITQIMETWWWDSMSMWDITEDFFCPCMFLFSYVLMSVWANRGIFMAWKDCFEDNAPRTSSVF